MPEPPVRVALLARPGDARDQLRRALADAGAELVAEGDPNDLAPSALADGRPGVVVVSLEPAIEDALERFDEVLAADGLEVIYDDAEVTRQLDGWDLARWARHLAAKLAGGDTVLPPLPEGQELPPPPTPAAALDLPDLDLSALQPGAPPSPAQEMDAEKLEDYAAESLELSDWVPTKASLATGDGDGDGAGGVATPAQDAAQDVAPDAGLDLDLDLAGLEEAMAGNAEPTAPPLASNLEASGIDIPQQLDIDDTPAAADAGFDAPLAFDGDAPPALDDDAPLELDADAGVASFDAGDDAPLDLDAGEPSLADAPPDDAPLSFDDAAALDFDDAPLDFDDGTADAGTVASPVVADVDAGQSDHLDLGLDVDLSALEDAPAADPDAPAEASTGSVEDGGLVLADATAGDAGGIDAGPIRFSSFDSDDGAPAEAGLDDDVAALAAQLEAFEAADQREAPREPDFASLAADEPAPAAPAAGESAAAPPAAAAPSGGSPFDNLELVPMDADMGKVLAADGDTPPAPSLVPGAERRSALNLAGTDETKNVQAVPGALFVIAGLGGPDGVRQLLAALPPTLPVPVLLYQHLDTGKHERLVTQLAKASKLPLDLAVEGKMAFPGRVAVLQPGIGIQWREEHIEFTREDGLGALVAALPAADSAVLVLSGADTAVMPSVLALGAGGGMLLAQDPETCFDPAAPQAVIAAGGLSAPLAELARTLVDRWTR